MMAIFTAMYDQGIACHGIAAISDRVVAPFGVTAVLVVAGYPIHP